MPDKQAPVPDSTAVRTALWRAMHVQVDPPPHVFEGELGLKLAAPDEGWRDRQDMHPQWTARFRAAIVARARFVEDLVAEQTNRGVGQYIILVRSSGRRRGRPHPQANWGRGAPRSRPFVRKG